MKRVSSPQPYGAQAWLYDQEYKSYVDDIPFYLNLLHTHPPRGPILDLGCGTGRVSFPLVQAGHSVVGVDVSDPMLRRARQRLKQQPEELQARLRFYKRDITKLAFSSPMGAVLAPFSVLCLLPSREQVRQCLARSASVLAPGGLLVADVFAASERTRQARDESPRLLYSFRLPSYGHMVDKFIQERYDPDHRWLEVRYFFVEKDYYGEKTLREQVIVFTLMLLEPEELCAWAEEVGLEVKMLYGDYFGQPLQADSGRLLLECVRRRA